MIWIMSFFWFLVLELKGLIFLNGFLFRNFHSIFICRIIPVVILLFSFFTFFYFSRKDYYFFSFIYFLVCFLILFCFLVSNSFLFLVSLEITVYPIVFLILSSSKDEEKIVSVFFIFFINIFGSLPFMYFSSYL